MLSVTNIAFVFDLSDGQKRSIWFHNPKKTPSNVLPDDIMISWKWMLNKRNVNAALSPSSGNNVQLSALAGSINSLAAKNSKHFKVAQVLAAENGLKLPNQYKVHLEVRAAELESGIFEYVGYNHKKIDSKKAYHQVS